MVKKKRTSLLSMLGVIFITLSGCATLSAPYPQKMAKIKSQLTKDEPSQAQKSFAEELATNENQLNLLESGRLAQLNGDVAQSQQDYARVINQVATSQMAAKVQVSKVLQNARAILTNDREMPYAVPDYAMTFLYPYQALNYLSQHDLRGALVAIRQLSNAQYWTYQQKLMAGDLKQKYQQDTAKVGVDKEHLDVNKSKQIKDMFNSVSHIENAYENGFGYYLASILYEAFDQNYNNAFVSIKSAKRLLPDNPYVLSTYQQMQKGFDGGSAYQKDKGRLVVLYEQGFVEAKSAFKLPLFLGKLGLQEIAVPYYASTYTLLPAQSVYVTKEKQIIAKGKTAMLVNTTAMATKSLTEEYSVIITREVVRLVVKSLATLEASNRAGGWGALIGSIYSFVTAQADQRSWLLLPNNIQLYETQLKKGAYQLDVTAKNYHFMIKSEQTTLVWIVNMGAFDKAYVFVI